MCLAKQMIAASHYKSSLLTNKSANFLCSVLIFLPSKIHKFVRLRSFGVSCGEKVQKFEAVSPQCLKTKLL